MITPHLSYELRLGVTGHRTFADEAAVERAVEGVLRRIRETLKPSDAAPLTWTVVSALARGADRLVADAVVNSGGRLEAVLPFSLEEYQKDFDATDDRAHFDRLLSRASTTVVTRALHDRIPAGEHTRDRGAAYRRAGEHTVHHCELLIAIWDGQPGNTGGTSDIVDYAAHQGRVVVWIDPATPDAALRIIDPALRATGVPLPRCAVNFPTSAKALSPHYHQFASYCVDRARTEAFYQEKIAERMAELTAAATAAGFDVAALEPVRAAIVPHYVRASELASVYRRRHRWAVATVPCVAAAAVTIAVGQVVLFPARLWLILLEVFAMCGILALWTTGRLGAWHERGLNDRYFAEQLRMLTFTWLVGARDGDALERNPLPFYHGPEHWVPTAIAAVAREMPPSPSVPFESLRAFVAKGWLDEQHVFHRNTARRSARRATIGHALGQGLFAITLAMALLHFFGVGHATDSHAPPIERVDSWIAFLALVLPAWAGAVHAVTSQLEFERIAERSERMSTLLARSRARIQECRDVPELRLLCATSAELMDAEVRDWWVLLSFQQLHLRV